MSVQSYHTATNCELREAYLNMCTALYYGVDVCETRGTLHFHNHYFSYVMELVVFHAAYNKVVKCILVYSRSEERSPDRDSFQNMKKKVTRQSEKVT